LAGDKTDIALKGHPLASLQRKVSACPLAVMGNS